MYLYPRVGLILWLQRSWDSKLSVDWAFGGVEELPRVEFCPRTLVPRPFREREATERSPNAWRFDCGPSRCFAMLSSFDISASGGGNVLNPSSWGVAKTESEPPSCPHAQPKGQKGVVGRADCANPKGASTENTFRRSCEPSRDATMCLI